MAMLNSQRLSISLLRLSPRRRKCCPQFVDVCGQHEFNQYTLRRHGQTRVMTTRMFGVATKTTKKKLRWLMFGYHLAQCNGRLPQNDA